MTNKSTTTWEQEFKKQFSRLKWCVDDVCENCNSDNERHCVGFEYLLNFIKTTVMPQAQKEVLEELFNETKSCANKENAKGFELPIIFTEKAKEKLKKLTHKEE